MNDRELRDMLTDATLDFIFDTTTLDERKEIWGDRIVQVVSQYFEKVDLVELVEEVRADD